METQATFTQHFAVLTIGVLGPMNAALTERRQSQRLISNGQQLVEKSLMDRLPDDEEPWRESLNE